MQTASAMAVAVLTAILAWIPYVRTTPEYDHVVEIVGGRPEETRTTDPAELAALLQGRSVLLIPEQQETTEDVLVALGAEMSSVIRAFLARGGRIVGMSYSKGAEDILRGAGLWDVNDGYDVTGADLAVAVPGHPLTAGVSLAFQGPDGSTDFSGLPDDSVILVWDTFDRAPVVFTWKTGGGAVHMLGFDLFEYTPDTAQLLRNALGFATGSLSGPTGDSEVVHDLGVPEIEEILVDLRLTFDRRTDSYGDPVWVLYLDGLAAVLSVDDAVEETPGRFRYLGLYAGWTTGGRVPCETVNAWNRLTRGSRAFVDNEGDVALETDLYVGDGVTMASARAFVERFARLARVFADYLAEE
ncbi:MAG: hypothetical protein BIP78_0908 [Candidatus Bipolaricaulis sibiricus]|uniref:DUF4350 domain-containing protein n=1 Tax=Bipolaricaulis sibiricus TaxID=2501609 RepID=A0A410FUK0_BIPS1|nr:MAG: hypothetical protein BIP78_0908 [Candidatus Bipolaricaulis sibiricus]